jgi:hypothetical protein
MAPKKPTTSRRTSTRDADGRLAKLLRLGMGAVWMTEEGVRKAVQDLRMPRDATAYLLEQIDKRKSEIFTLVRNEIQRAFKKVDTTQLVKNILKSHDLEIEAKIRFKPRKRA